MHSGVKPTVSVHSFDFCSMFCILKIRNTLKSKAERGRPVGPTERSVLKKNLSSRPILVKYLITQPLQQFCQVANFVPFFGAKIQTFSNTVTLCWRARAKVSSTTTSNWMFALDTEGNIIVSAHMSGNYMSNWRRLPLHYGGNTRRIYILPQFPWDSNKMECNRILWGFEHGIKVR